MYRSWTVKLRITLITALIIGVLARLPVANSAEGTAPLEEIVVTAQKREQSLLDVGIAISVLTGEELSQLRVEEVGDLALHVSNMNVKNTLGATNPVVTIRGVGLNDFNANNNPTAGVYIDEVSSDFYGNDGVPTLRHGACGSPEGPAGHSLRDATRRRGR